MYKGVFYTSVNLQYKIYRYKAILIMINIAYLSDKQ